MSSFFTKESPPKHKEGDLFKILKIFGKSFEIYYGYYEDFEKDTPYSEPIPIYPDFLKNPVYTRDGLPFITQMQDACIHYIGKETDDKECAECKHYRHGDGFIGVCGCEKNKRGGQNDDREN